MILRNELRDLVRVAVEGVQAMALGEQLAVVLIVGASDELGSITYDVGRNVDDVATRTILEKALDTFDQIGNRPAGQA